MHKCVPRYRKYEQIQHKQQPDWQVGVLRYADEDEPYCSRTLQRMKCQFFDIAVRRRTPCSRNFGFLFPRLRLSLNCAFSCNGLCRGENLEHCVLQQG